MANKETFLPVARENVSDILQKAIVRHKSRTGNFPTILSLTLKVCESTPSSVNAVGLDFVRELSDNKLKAFIAGGE